MSDDADDAPATELGDELERSSELPFGHAQHPGLQVSHQAKKIGTTNSGLDYIEECLNTHGVPVPWTVLDPADGWVNHGNINNPFEAPNWTAELWTWESSDPDGVCMALPRWQGNQARLFGVICLGRTTSKTCFWDNPNGTYFQKGNPIPLDAFVGGFQLEANFQGICSDCHAGENPFVVHPDEAAFESAKATVNLDPLTWPTPVVPDLQKWPGNPGPIQKLGPNGPNEQRCDGCHVKGNAGRFPLVSSALPGYCGKILRGAMWLAAHDGTMPPGEYAKNFDMDDYAAHRDWLLAACASSPGTIDTVDPPSTPTLSPPIIEEPLYGCAQHVVVTGARHDARVELYIDNNFVDVQFPPIGIQAEFTLADPLNPGEVVSAVQSLGGNLNSAPGSAVVRDIHDDFEDGLPPPTIDPEPIYECATAIAISNVPGATLTVTKHTAGGTTVHTTTTGASHTWFGGLGPAFNVGDRFSVRQLMCDEDDESDESPIVEAKAAPATIPPATFDPPALMEGQTLVTLDSIVQGAAVAVWEQTAGFLWLDSSVPYNWLPGIDVATPLGSPIQWQHQVNVTQQLCSTTSPPTSAPPVEPCNNETLAVSVEIAQPTGGDDFVLVTQGVPGETIRVLDSTQEIGNGSGFAIALTRPLVSSEVIAVVQELGSCTSTLGYFVAVL